LQSHPRYSYKYGVTDYSTGDIKSQSESRDGDIVKGQYSLVEPDGTIRTVHYTADSVNGFNAVVKKTGQPAIHPTEPLIKKPIVVTVPLPSAKPVYKEPLPYISNPVVYDTTYPTKTPVTYDVYNYEHLPPAPPANYIKRAYYPETVDNYYNTYDVAGDYPHGGYHDYGFN
jgi:hypothetical protein